MVSGCGIGWQKQRTFPSLQKALSDHAARECEFCDRMHHGFLLCVHPGHFFHSGSLNACWSDFCERTNGKKSVSKRSINNFLERMWRSHQYSIKSKGNSPHYSAQIKLRKVSGGPPQKKKNKRGAGSGPDSGPNFFPRTVFWLLKWPFGLWKEKPLVPSTGLSWSLLASCEIKENGEGKEAKLAPPQMDSSGLAEVGAGSL